MPIYEYRCRECGEVFSLLHLRPADANEGERCAACGSEQTQRLLSSFAIGGRVDPGPGPSAWPRSWNDTNAADPETLRYWRRRIEREVRLEEKYPELRERWRKQASEATAAGEDSHSEHHHHHHHSHTEPGSTGHA